MWVAGDAAQIVDNLTEEEILLGTKQLLRFVISKSLSLVLDWFFFEI